MRKRISLNQGWKFIKYETLEEADNLIYDIRPEIFENPYQLEADIELVATESLVATKQA